MFFAMVFDEPVEECSAALLNTICGDLQNPAQNAANVRLRVAVCDFQVIGQAARVSKFSGKFLCQELFPVFRFEFEI